MQTQIEGHLTTNQTVPFKNVNVMQAKKGVDKGVQPVAQDGCECSPKQNRKFT